MTLAVSLPVRVLGAALDIAAAIIGVAGAVPQRWELKAGQATVAYRVPPQ
jgi:hypothetical protein